MNKYFQNTFLKFKLGGDVSSNKPTNLRKIENKYMNADHLFKEFAKRKKFKNPMEILLLPQEKRDDVLYKFVNEAVDKFDSLDIALSIIKYRYAAKLTYYMDTSKDQAAGLITLSDTVHMNLFEMFEGGVPIIESGKDLKDGKLLNGTFGRKMNCTDISSLNIANEVADTLYLPDHDHENELPQASFFLFAARSKDSKDFEEKRKLVTAHRTAFKEKLLDVRDKTNQFYVTDPKREDATKFRLLCAVFDMEKGKLMVVSDNHKSPQQFSDWVAANLKDVLSASDKEIDAIQKFVEKPGGLAEHLSIPLKERRDFHPWSNLLSEVGNDYKRAVKIWRYAMIKRQVENVRKYEARWEKIKQVEKVLEATCWIACDDGREPGNINVLAAMPSKKEFMSFFKGNNKIDMRLLIFAPHYICGMLKTLHSLHNIFKHLGRALEQERKDPPAGVGDPEFEYEKKVGYFKGLIENVLKKDGPVASRDILNKHLPAYLLDEIKSRDIYEKDEKKEDMAMVEFLHGLFVENKEKFRSVIRRGFEIGMLESGENSLPYMPAAKETYERLGAYFGSYKFRPEEVTAFVIEEAIRMADRTQNEWMQELPANLRIKRISFIRNNRNGQAVIIPDVPKSPDDFLDMERKDYFLENMFSPEDLQKLGLEKFRIAKMIA